MYVIIIIIIDQLTENVQIRREKKIKGEREAATNNENIDN